MSDLRDHHSHAPYPIELTHLQPNAGSDSLFARTHEEAPRLQLKPEFSSGQISSMAVPDGWVRQGDLHLHSGAGLVEFHPQGNSEVSLISYFRGHRLSRDASQAFKNVLAQPPHHLRSHELQSISEVLRDKDNNFDIFFASTSDLNGKRVLTVEGAYKDQDHTGSKTIFVDSDGTGSAIQEISYTARGNNYQKHSTEASKAIHSIQWRS